MRLRRILPLLLFALLLLRPSAWAEDARAGKATPERTVRDFGPADKNRDRWRIGPEAGAAALGVKVFDPACGESLAIPVAFPEISQAWCIGKLSSFNRGSDAPAYVAETLDYDLFLPKTMPAGMRIQCRLLLKNKDGFWFEALGRRRDGMEWKPATALAPGWNHIEVDLSDDSAELSPRGHGMRWSRYFLSQVTAIGFNLQGDGDWRGEAALDNIVVVPATDRAFPERFLLSDVSGPENVTRYGLAEFSFSVNRPLLNPFRQKEICADAIFYPPSGGEPIVVPAFYYQGYARVPGDDNASDAGFDDVYYPAGAGKFLVRFTPREAGEYGWELKATQVSPVSGRAESYAGPRRTLRVEPAQSKGFVRISRLDPRCFEFEDGEYFFPIGHSFRSPADPRHYQEILRKYFPSDPKPRDTGLRIYERLLPEMHRSGMNCLEAWMCSWWLGLEWTGAWKNYHGLGRYNLEHAWKLDRLVDLAAANDIYIHLTIDNHGKAGQNLGRNRDDGQFDHEFEFSPYNERNRADGGFLDNCLDLFTDDLAKEYYRDLYRYIAARWGWSRNIYAFELWSELDLIGSNKGRQAYQYKTPAVRGWHEEMAAWLRKLDQGKHVITTHYSGDWSVVDAEMVAKPCIEYLACDAYHETHETLLNMLCETEDYALGVGRGRDFGKPFMITEYGGFAYAAPLPSLRGDLYGGLWWGWMSRSAGTPLYWWFELVDRENYRTAYAALAKFVAGEDKRRTAAQPQLRSGSLLWRGKGESPRWNTDRKAGWPLAIGAQNDDQANSLSALVLGDGAVFYAYVYDHEQLNMMPDAPAERRKQSGVFLTIANDPGNGYAVDPGRRAVEVWDCWTGKIVSTAKVDPDEAGNLRILLPEFTIHTAVKIKQTGDPAAPPPPSTMSASAR